MNVEGEEPHVYLLEISDGRWELERNQRNREYVYFTSPKSMRVGDLKFLQDTDDREYGQNSAALLIFTLNILLFNVDLWWNSRESRDDEGWLL